MKNKVRKIIRQIYWLSSTQFGLDVRRFIRSLMNLPHYLSDWIEFRKVYKGKLNFLPCLHDWHEEGGATKNEYFLQDLYVAQKIYNTKPEKHVDIGSRIDGFVAHVASYREVEIFDIRPVTSSIPGIVYRQADLMSSSDFLIDYCDSLSCLHALEHFGLGRYGDPIDPYGYISGFRNMSKIIRQGGIFYLSTPIGVERVEFNAHRIFNPTLLIQLAAENNLSLLEFSWVNPDHKIIQSSNPAQDMKELGELYYTLGIFTFIKQ